MKKIYLLLLPFIFFAVTTNAQDKKGKEKIHALKIAYLIEELDLTSNEADLFWPLYNEYHKKRKTFFSFEKELLKEKTKNDIANLTEKEAIDVLNKLSVNNEKKHENKIIFHQKLLKILPAKKIIKYKMVERSFNKKLMHKLKNKHKE